MEVKRNLLSGQLVIKVKERKPIAIVAESKNAMTFDVVDINGFVMAHLTKDELLSYPHKDMIFIFKGNANLALDALSGIRSIIPNIYSEISHIDARDSCDIIIHIKNGLKVRVAGDRIKEGLIDIIHFIANPRIQEMETDLNYIDARFPGADLLRLALAGGEFVGKVGYYNRAGYRNQQSGSYRQRS